jgi:hypothetical protein
MSKQTATATPIAPSAPPARRPAPPQPANIPAGIPVRRLNLVRPMQVPGYPATQAVETRELANGERWEIEFIPQLRHHRITHWPAQLAKPVKTEYLHEQHVVTWEAAPPTEPTK